MSKLREIVLLVVVNFISVVLNLILFNMLINLAHLTVIPSGAVALLANFALVLGYNLKFALHKRSHKGHSDVDLPLVDKLNRLYFTGAALAYTFFILLWKVSSLNPSLAEFSASLLLLAWNLWSGYNLVRKLPPKTV